MSRTGKYELALKDLAEAVDDFRTQYTDELKLQADNSTLMIKQQTQAYYRYRIDSMKASIKNDEDRLDIARTINNEKEIRNAEGALRLHTSNLRNLEREM